MNPSRIKKNIRKNEDFQYGLILSVLYYNQNNDIKCKFGCENELYWNRMGTERTLTRLLESRVIENTAIIPKLIRKQKDQKADIFTSNLVKRSTCKVMKH